MASRQSLLGQCLLSPFSQGQEDKEKMFFRRNTEIISQLFSTKANKRWRPMSETGPIRDVYSNHDVINIPSARHVMTSSSSASSYRDVIKTRPHTTSPVSASKKSLQIQRRTTKQSYHFTQPFVAADNNLKQLAAHQDGCLGHSWKFGNGNESPNKMNGGKSPESQKRSCIKKKCVKKINKNGNKKENSVVVDSGSNHGDDVGGSDDDNDNSEESSERSLSRHEMLLESHRHPPSIHCDTLGPASCKHCTRRASLSDASFILPSSGVFSNRTTTIRLPPRPSTKTTAPPPSAMVPFQTPNQYSPTTPVVPDRHTPISVFLRTRKKRDEEIHRIDVKDENEKNKDDLKICTMTSTENGGKGGRGRGEWRRSRSGEEDDDDDDLRDEIQEVAEANVDVDVDVSDDNLDGMRFDGGMKVRVTFKEKLHDSS